MKQICVIGLGQFGSHLARTLARMRCEVLAIDADEKAVHAVRDKVQQTAILDVRNFEALQSVVTSQIDEAVICLSENMESSILCALHLKRIGARRIRAKAASRDHADILKAIGATDLIFPEQETADRMAHRIVNPDLLDYLPLSPEYQVVQIDVPAAFVGQSLAGLHLRKRYRVLVIAIKRTGPDRVEFMPPAESTLQAGDTLVLIGKGRDIESLPA